MSRLPAPYDRAKAEAASGLAQLPTAAVPEPSPDRAALLHAAVPAATPAQAERFLCYFLGNAAACARILADPESGEIPPEAAARAAASLPPGDLDCVGELVMALHDAHEEREAPPPPAAADRADLAAWRANEPGNVPGPGGEPIPPPDPAATGRA